MAPRRAVGTGEAVGPTAIARRALLVTFHFGGGAGVAGGPQPGGWSRCGHGFLPGPRGWRRPSQAQDDSHSSRISTDRASSTEKCNKLNHISSNSRVGVLLNALTSKESAKGRRNRRKHSKTFFSLMSKHAARSHSSRSASAAIRLGEYAPVADRGRIFRPIQTVSRIYTFNFVRCSSRTGLSCELQPMRARAKKNRSASG